MQILIIRYNNCKIRVAFVGYRDHCDGDDRIESFDFGSVDDFESFLGEVRAMGGGDTAEDVHGGLEAAINLSWMQANKTMIHIADAPAHGSRFHDGVSDQYRGYNDEDVRGLRMEDLIGKIKMLKIDYTFGKINSCTDKMVDEFKNIGGNNFVKCADMADLKDFTFAAVESISCSIDNNWKNLKGAVRPAELKGLSMISEGETSKVLKRYTIEKSQPNWSFTPEKSVRVGTCTVLNFILQQLIRVHIVVQSPKIFQENLFCLLRY